MTKIFRFFHRRLRIEEVLIIQNIPQSLPQAGVVLRPFFFAGLGKNLSYAQHTEAEPTPYDLSEPLTEFRVLFPVFFI